MDKTLRNKLKRKQDKLVIRRGVPSLSDLSIGVPELRVTKEGLVEYVRVENTIYKRNYNKVTRDRGMIKPIYTYGVHTCNFNRGGTTAYIPLSSQTTSEGTALTGANEHLTLLAPYNGHIMKILFRSENAISDGTTPLKYEIFEQSDGTELPVAKSPVCTKQEIVDLAANTVHEMKLGTMDSGTNALTKGKIYSVKLTTPDNMDDTNITVVYRWNIAETIKTRGSVSAQDPELNTSNRTF